MKLPVGRDKLEQALTPLACRAAHLLDGVPGETLWPGRTGRDHIETDAHAVGHAHRFLCHQFLVIDRAAKYSPLDQDKEQQNQQKAQQQNTPPEEQQEELYMRESWLSSLGDSEHHRTQPGRDHCMKACEEGDASEDERKDNQ